PAPHLLRAPLALPRAPLRRPRHERPARADLRADLEAGLELGDGSRGDGAKRVERGPPRMVRAHDAEPAFRVGRVRAAVAELVPGQVLDPVVARGERVRSPQSRG